MAEAYGSRRTFYSAEGSSLCIKAMLGIVCRSGQGKKITVAAPRNVHKAFINACILLDVDVEWIYPKGEFTSICAGSVTPEDVEKVLSRTKAEDLKSIMPYIVSIHGKFYNMSEDSGKPGTYQDISMDYTGPVKFLKENGYEGYNQF